MVGKSKNPSGTSQVVKALPQTRNKKIVLEVVFVIWYYLQLKSIPEGTRARSLIEEKPGKRFQRKLEHRASHQTDQEKVHIS